MLIATWLVAPPGAAAQATLEAGADAAFRTNLYWRGLLRDDRPALYPEAWVSAASGAGHLTLGAWTQVRFADPDPAPSPDVALGDALFGASDLWLEASLALGRGALALGVDALLYRGRPTGQTAAAANTAEVYASAWWDTGIWIPRARVAVDLAGPGGAYAETGVELRVPTLPSRNPVVALSLGATAGWSIGQSWDGWPIPPQTPAYYASDGLTHVETLLRLAVGHGAAQLWLEVGGQLARADGYRPAGPDGSRTPGSGWWLGVGAADALLLGRF